MAARADSASLSWIEEGVDIGEGAVLRGECGRVRFQHASDRHDLFSGNEPGGALDGQSAGEDGEIRWR